MAAEMLRLALVIAGGLLLNDDQHADAIVCLDQARQIIADARDQPGRSDVVRHEIALGYADANADAAAWKTLDGIWSTHIRVSALACLIAEMYAMLGDKESAIAESTVVSKRLRRQVLERVAVGLAEAGRIQDALDLARDLAHDHHATLALWEVAEVAARKGWAKRAAKTIVAVYTPPKEPPVDLESDPPVARVSIPIIDGIIDSEGVFVAAKTRGLRAVCEALSTAGLPGEALSLLNELKRYGLSSHETALGLVSVAEGMIAAE